MHTRLLSGSRRRLPAAITGAPPSPESPAPCAPARSAAAPVPRRTRPWTSRVSLAGPNLRPWASAGGANRPAPAARTPPRTAASLGSLAANARASPRRERSAARARRRRSRPVGSPLPACRPAVRELGVLGLQAAGAVVESLGLEGGVAKRLEQRDAPVLVASAPSLVNASTKYSPKCDSLRSNAVLVAVMITRFAPATRDQVAARAREIDERGPLRGKRGEQPREIGRVEVRAGDADARLRGPSRRRGRSARARTVMPARRARRSRGMRASRRSAWWTARESGARRLTLSSPNQYDVRVGDAEPVVQRRREPLGLRPRTRRCTSVRRRGRSRSPRGSGTGSRGRQPAGTRASERQRGDRVRHGCWPHANPPLR